VALTFAVGCVPSVTHGPRVEPGPSAEFSVGLQAPRNRANEGGWPPFVFPPASGNIAYGLRDNSLDFGLRVAGGISAMLQFQADVYAQLPRRALLGLDGGVGVAAIAPSPANTAPMPYAEVGWIRAGNGPYAVAGYVHEIVDTNKAGAPEVLHADGWVGTLAYQFSHQQGRVRPFATAVIGRKYPMHCYGAGSDCSAFRPPRALFAGLSIEAGPHW
jgi:hypothetical protein